MPIVNRYIPFRTFAAVNIFGLIFVKKGYKFTEADLRHELIHTRQMRELLFIPFYIVYFGEWLVRLVQYRSLLRAYFNVSFEREAYLHQAERDYLKKRPLYAWRHYLRKASAAQNASSRR